MIERRVRGIANLFVAITATAACAYWLLLEEIFDWIRMNEEANLLPTPAYLLVAVIGISFSWRTITRLSSNLVFLDWAGSMRLAIRQVFGLVAAVFTTIVVFKDPGISRIFLGTYFVTVWILLATINRTVPKKLVRSVYQGKQRSRTLVAVPLHRWEEFKEWIDRQEDYGTQLVGLLDLHSPIERPSDLPSDIPVFTSPQEAIQQANPAQIIVLTTGQPEEEMREIVGFAHESGSQVYFYNDYADRLGIPLQPVTFDGKPFLAIGNEPLEDPLNRALKRAVDLILAIPIAVLVLPPLALLVALIQRVQSRGPVFFTQSRTGRKGVAFNIYKFRTMEETEDGERAKIYRFGAFLRRTSLDELPQIINVLKNEMSMVGPRPHIFEDDLSFTETVRVYRMRFFVKPGITGLAQSRGFRGEITAPADIENRLNLDLLYINEWSPWLDLAILSRTLREIFIPPDSAK
ncbi:MAG: hypothetical protein SynsKO_12840 [Synoicihabitans sp.]